MNDAGRVDRAALVAAKPVCTDSLTRGVTAHRFRDDQCLSTRTGGMAAKSTRRGTIQIFLVCL